MSGNFSVRTVVVDSIDCLRQPVSDADVEHVQLGRGLLRGTLTKAAFDDLSYAQADFSLPLRASGILGTTNVTISMLLGSAGKSKSWGQELNAGDVFLSAPGKTLDAVFGERSNVTGISIAPHDIASVFVGEPALCDVGYWMQNHQYTSAPQVSAAIAARVSQIASWLAQGPMLAGTTADFWRRCLIEAFTANFVHSMSSDIGAIIPSTVKLVRVVEDYLRSHSHRAVHVSELCSALTVSRRTLHRAFHDVLGIGPITFLRHYRLCLIHENLRRAVPGEVHVTDVATEFGFFELGRFAQLYLSLFGEYPSQTLLRESHPSYEVYRRDRSA
jgi:AraC family ethanolamine operon transcriptional activator